MLQKTHFVQYILVYSHLYLFTVHNNITMLQKIKSHLSYMSHAYKRHTSFNIFWYILICTYLRFTKSVTMLQKTHFVQYILVYSHLYLFTVHKIRHYVTKDTLRSIYFGIFSSVLIYGSQNPSLCYKRHTSFNIFWYILICTYLRFTNLGL